MSKEIYRDLSNEAQVRHDASQIEAMQQMADLYRGHIPPEYEKYFPSTAPKHIVQLVKNAWNDLTAEVGKFPDLVSDPLDETSREDKKAGLHERIGANYLNNAEPTGKQFMKQIAWWLVGVGRAVAIVEPDDDKMLPIFGIRDPRSAKPNMRTVGNVPVEIYDLLFDYEIPHKVAVELGLAEKGNWPAAGPYTGDAKKTKVIEFMDREQHLVVSETGAMIRKEHGLGIVPGWVFQNFSPDDKDAGQSMFRDQVSLMVAVSMLISMKLAAADKNVNPIYFAKGHVGTLKIGPNVINKLSAQGEIGRIDPPIIPQVDRDIDMLVGFSNILNKNPEVRQGQVDTAGSYMSAASLEEMASAIDNTVGDYWDIIAPGLEHMFEVAYRMDEKRWPNEEKRITSNIKGKKMRDVYKPAENIDGRYAINVNYGFGTGGYQGFLQNLQANEAGVRSRKAAIEQMPGVSDVDQELRQIQLENLDDAQMANIQSQAAQGGMDMIFMAELRQMVAKGMKIDEAIVKLTEQAQAQAQQAMETGATAPVTNPAPEEAPVEEAPLPGLPPQAVA
jgi:hypothetical protein